MIKIIILQCYIIQQQREYVKVAIVLHWFIYAINLYFLGLPFSLVTLNTNDSVHLHLKRPKDIPWFVRLCEEIIYDFQQVDYIAYRQINYRNRPF